MSRSRTRFLLACALPAALAGCMLGPDYVRPQVAESAQAQPRLVRADPQAVVAAPPLQRWWTQLDDPQLDWLVDQALANSPNLHAAEAQLRAARALVRQRRAEMLPSIGATAVYGHATAPDWAKDGVRDTAGQVADAIEGSAGAEAAQAIRQRAQALDMDMDLYDAGFDASWELDLFGRRRRAAEGARAKAEASAADLADAQVQLTAEVAQAYLGYRGNRERLAIARDNLERAERILALTRQRRERGADSDLQVERAVAQVHQQEAVVPQLEADAQVALDQLALMIGREPGALDAMFAEDRPLPALPQRVEVDDAAALIRRRPDVRRAERELAASSAQIGHALSAYFPQVTLLGSLGMFATSASDLGADAVNWAVAPMLRWSVFDFGRAGAQVAQARAGNQARLAAYQGAVLAALQDANGALSRFGAARRQLGSAQKAQASTERAAALMEQRNAAGASSLIDTLDVQRQRLSAQDGAAQAQLQLLVDYVALQKSLGLGWGVPPDGAADEAATAGGGS